MRGPRVALRATATSKVCVFFFSLYSGRTTGWSAIINIFRKKGGNGITVCGIGIGCRNVHLRMCECLDKRTKNYYYYYFDYYYYDYDYHSIWCAQEPDNPLQIWIVSFRFVPPWSQGDCSPSLAFFSILLAPFIPFALHPSVSVFFRVFLFVLLSTLHALCIASQMSHLSAH